MRTARCVPRSTPCGSLPGRRGTGGSTTQLLVATAGGGHLPSSSHPLSVISHFSMPRAPEAARTPTAVSGCCIGGHRLNYILSTQASRNPSCLVGGSAAVASWAAARALRRHPLLLAPLARWHRPTAPSRLARPRCRHPSAAACRILGRISYPASVSAHSPRPAYPATEGFSAQYVTRKWYAWRTLIVRPRAHIPIFR